MSRNPVPIHALELRCSKVPRGTLIAILERQTGRPITHQYRHYLAGLPVHCGDLLELYRHGEWILGRYEWTGIPGELPTFQSGELILRLDRNHLLRWPE